MAVRVALLTEPVDTHHAALQRSLTDLPRIELRVFRPRTGSAPTFKAERPLPPSSDTETHASEAASSGARDPGSRLTNLLASLPFGTWLQLVAFRPELVICEEAGRAAVQAALYRWVVRRSRLLLFTTDSRPAGLRERTIFGAADGVLAAGHAVSEAVARASVPELRVFPLVVPDELQPFVACAETRPAEAAHRIVYAGDLSPHSGAVDFLSVLARWAEQHPTRPTEIWWIGEGDLAGVLSAQPLPASLSQRFLGRLDRQDVAHAFAQCGLLVVPSLTDDDRPLLDEALAAGLPVLGSNRSRRTRRVICEDVTGWLFDPLHPSDTLDAIGRALGTPEDRLVRMRDKAQRLACPAAALDFAEGVRRAVAAVLADSGSEVVRRRVPGPVSDLG